MFTARLKCYSLVFRVICLVLSSGLRVSVKILGLWFSNRVYFLAFRLIEILMITVKGYFLGYKRSVRSEKYDFFSGIWLQ